MFSMQAPMGQHPSMALAASQTQVPSGSGEDGAARQQPSQPPNGMPMFQHWPNAFPFPQQYGGWAGLPGPYQYYAPNPMQGASLPPTKLPLPRPSTATRRMARPQKSTRSLQQAASNTQGFFRRRAVIDEQARVTKYAKAAARARNHLNKTLFLPLSSRRRQSATRILVWTRSGTGQRAACGRLQLRRGLQLLSVLFPILHRVQQRSCVGSWSRAAWTCQMPGWIWDLHWRGTCRPPLATLCKIQNACGSFSLGPAHILYLAKGGQGSRTQHCFKDLTAEEVERSEERQCCWERSATSPEVFLFSQALVEQIVDIRQSALKPSQFLNTAVLLVLEMTTRPVSKTVSTAPSSAASEAMPDDSVPELAQPRQRLRMTALSSDRIYLMIGLSFSTFDEAGQAQAHCHLAWPLKVDAALEPSAAGRASPVSQPLALGRYGALEQTGADSEALMD
ncbi:MAG: hypothetical protein FRX49_04000 [Trebouxia sp. A1-2]|nr:MAG: hypothetical protein FRX49_04000 [Trebouxia sp. A1-2]